MQEFGFIKFSPENIYLKVCFCQFTQSTEHLIPELRPEFFSGCVEGQQLQGLVTVEQMASDTLLLAVQIITMDFKEDKLLKESPSLDQLKELLFLVFPRNFRQEEI